MVTAGGAGRPPARASSPASSTTPAAPSPTTGTTRPTPRPGRRRRGRELPILTRAAVQDAGLRLRSDAVPRRPPARVRVVHVGVHRAARCTVQATMAASLFFAAITLRDHLWHRRDPLADGGRHPGLSAPAPSPPRGCRTRSGARPCTRSTGRGRCTAWPLSTDVATQARWLVGIDPDYLLTLPPTWSPWPDHFLATGEPPAPAAGGAHHGRGGGARGAGRLCRERVGRPRDRHVQRRSSWATWPCSARRGEHYHVQSEVVVCRDPRRGRASRAGRARRAGWWSRPSTTSPCPCIRYEVGRLRRGGRAPAPADGGCPCSPGSWAGSATCSPCPTGERFWPVFAARVEGDRTPSARSRSCSTTSSTSRPASSAPGP